MPTEAPAKPKQQTWLDLLPQGTPEPLLITRDELIGALRERGVDVNEVTLVYWEREGILPRPIRRRHAGAPRALYPVYAINAVEHLRQLQDAGRTLDQIAPLMRTWALAQVDWRDPLGESLTEARAALLRVAEALHADVTTVNTIAVTFTNDAGQEVFTHKFPVPVELRQSPSLHR